MKKNHERILKSFQNDQRQSVIGKEEVKNQINELHQKHQDEMQNLTDSYQLQTQEREASISKLNETMSKLQLDFTLYKDESKKEIETLKENLAIAEEERDKYRSSSVKDLKDQGKQFEDTIERLNNQIREKDELIEEKEREQQNAINEIDSNSQAKLAELKKFYDSEKQRFEQRVSDLKNQAQKRQTEVELEFKGQLTYEQEQKEEIQENLEMEIQNLNDQLMSLSN